MLKVIVRIGEGPREREFELTTEEAESLCEELMKLLGKVVVRPWIPQTTDWKRIEWTSSLSD